MTEATWLRTNSFTLPWARLAVFKTPTFPFMPFIGLLLRWVAGSRCRQCGALANAVIRHQMGVTGGTGVGAAARATSALSGGLNCDRAIGHGEGPGSPGPLTRKAPGSVEVGVKPAAGDKTLCFPYTGCEGEI